ncbi:peroxiredoxin family protein [Gorillibacterium massiliense]|uniref:peroxiredoxin family protein n=1 Tax=Gorillibacterium massiliense TaxID=1280390 RepID=UPI0004ADC51A|nr:redoxin domain-containing protein [Gorillibacterium massiliense]
MKKNGIAITILAGLILWGIFDYMKKPNNTLAPAPSSISASVPEGVTKGKRAPDFQLTDLNGNAIKLTDFRGKTVLLNFWATWCPPCKVEMPQMRDFYTQYKHKDVIILGVNLTDTEKNAGHVQSFASENGLTFPIVLDKKGVVADLYRVAAYPTTFIIDPDGIIRDKFQGAIDFDTMKDAYAKAKKDS